MCTVRTHELWYYLYPQAYTLMEHTTVRTDCGILHPVMPSLCVTSNGDVWQDQWYTDPCPHLPLGRNTQGCHNGMSLWGRVLALSYAGAQYYVQPQ